MNEVFIIIFLFILLGLFALLTFWDPVGRVKSPLLKSAGEETEIIMTAVSAARGDVLGGAASLLDMDGHKKLANLLDLGGLVLRLVRVYKKTRELKEALKEAAKEQIEEFVLTFSIFIIFVFSSFFFCRKMSK